MTGIITKEEAGREYVNYCAKGIPNTLRTVPFQMILRINKKLATLRRVAKNWGIISKKTAVVSTPTQIETLGPPMGSPGEGLGLTTREEGLINKTMKKNPCTDEQIKGLNSLCPIRSATPTRRGP